MVTFDDSESKKKIQKIREREEETLARILSEKYGVQYVDLDDVQTNVEALRLIPEDAARDAEIVAFNMRGKKVEVAVISPNNPKTQQVITDMTEHGYNPKVFMASHKSLEKAWARYKDLSYAAESKHGVLDVSSGDIETAVENIKNLQDAQNLIKKVLLDKKTYRISRIVETFLSAAMALSASDIHIEPEEESVRLRFRLDGVLTDIFRFDSATYKLIVSRIKLLSSLKLNVKDEAQDGRFSIKMRNTDIEIRTSTLPGSYGESIVMRILNPDAISVKIEQLGMDPDLLKIVLEEIKKPNGMILNTGPTGSGKTTTLYAFLQGIHTPDIKIITIEDPVEYHLAGIVQTQVDREKSYTFSSGLRAALRQDPDVIMVGEIRDGETADIAVNAALTGHLVFSTLHTNTAAGTFPRLINLGINAKILGSAINVSMAQRLVRKLCASCKKEIPLEGETRRVIERILDTLPSNKKRPQTDVVWQPAGCEKCNEGYKGRVGIFEAILVDEAIEKIVTENPSERDIQQAARKQGIPSMHHDSVLKILRGITSFNEVMRVIDLTGDL